MNHYKYELQNIIGGNGPESGTSQLKKTQNFLRGYAAAGIGTQKQKHLKRQEETRLIDFIAEQNLFYPHPISEDNYIASGAEQRVYRYDDFSVIKLNDRIFYTGWLDYMNSLLVHNYFFTSTAYQLLGFHLAGGVLYAVVKQDFILKTTETDLTVVKEFLAFNHFSNTRNNDYYSADLGYYFRRPAR